MFFYSEFHASYEEMTYIIDDSKDLYNKCIYLPEPIPFKYFMIIKEQEFYRQMWDIKIIVLKMVIIVVVKCYIILDTVRH